MELNKNKTLPTIRTLKTGLNPVTIWTTVCAGGAGRPRGMERSAAGLITAGQVSYTGGPSLSDVGFDLLLRMLDYDPGAYAKEGCPTCCCACRQLNQCGTRYRGPAASIS
jgi:hypothetical protein